MPTIEERIEAANAKLAELTAAQDSLKMQEVQIQEEMASLMSLRLGLLRRINNMWMCIHCGEGSGPDNHKCNKRILRAVAYGRELEHNKQAEADGQSK